MTQTEQGIEEVMMGDKKPSLATLTENLAANNKAFAAFLAEQGSAKKPIETTPTPEVVAAPSVIETVHSQTAPAFDDESVVLPPPPQLLDESIAPKPAVVEVQQPEPMKVSEQGLLSADAVNISTPVTESVAKPTAGDEREANLRVAREAAARQDKYLAELFESAHKMLSPTWENAASSSADKLEAVNAFLRLNKEKLHEQTPEGASAFFNRIGRSDLAVKVEEAAKLAVTLANQPAKADLEKSASGEAVAVAPERIAAPVAEEVPSPVPEEVVVNELKPETVISANEAAAITQEIPIMSEESIEPAVPAKIPWYKKLLGFGQPKAPAPEKNPLKIPAWKEVAAKDVAARKERRPIVSAPAEKPAAAPKVEAKKLTPKEVFRNEIIAGFKELQQSRIGPDGAKQPIGAKTAYERLGAILDKNINVKNISQDEGVEVMRDLFNAEVKPAPRILLAALLKDHGVDVGLGDEIAKFKTAKAEVKEEAFGGKFE